MSIKEKIQNKTLERLGNRGFKVIEDLAKDMKTLEQHMVVVTENQVEFEKYLKDINKKLDKLIQ